ncbi:hypothetical protein [Streptomyces sp. SID2888]|uniref:hypothetical protein n=1 Tax=Streptomyces sp. SID2888 TaxID=2690256 RepID=UPI001F2E89BE|nr:hypothetical protein [Streptomyces sp. SID2888]
MPASPPHGELAEGHTVEAAVDGRWVVAGAKAEQVGKLAAREGIRLLELSDGRASLEQACLALTADAAEFTAATAPSTTVPREA